MNQKSYEMDMCNGPLWNKILFFSVPLMFSNVLQVVFNMSDIAVVGKFAGPVPLGAVGSTSILISLTTGLMIGMANGVNALTALYIGQKNEQELKKTVHTAALLCLGEGILILAFGILFARTLLSLLHTKDILMPEAVVYLQIYLLGSPALALYNFGNAVLSAAGDTRRPLYYLSFAGALNILLNLFFVIVCHLSAAGVGIASVISQYVSALLILRALLRTKEAYGLRFGSLRLDRDKLSRILRIGVPSAVQNALFAVANLFVQSGVNSFDHVTVEGNSAAANSDSLVYDMMAAFYTGCTTFLAQNLGAGKWKRMIKSYGICLLYSFLLGLILGTGLYALRYPFLSIFTDDPQVIAAGMHRISVMALAYCISAFMDCTIAASRGMNRTAVPTVIVILGSCVFRIAWIYTVFSWIGTIESLYLLYPVSWTLTAAAEILYFAVIYRKGARAAACLDGE